MRKASRAVTDINDRLVHRWAFEAVVWGMPAVNYELRLSDIEEVR